MLYILPPGGSAQCGGDSSPTVTSNDIAVYQTCQKYSEHSATRPAVTGQNVEMCHHKQKQACCTAPMHCPDSYCSHTGGGDMQWACKPPAGSCQHKFAQVRCTPRARSFRWPGTRLTCQADARRSGKRETLYRARIVFGVGKRGWFEYLLHLPDYTAAENSYLNSYLDSIGYFTIAIF